MSTPAPAPIRLLIAEASANRAHEIDSMLRDAGVPTRPSIMTDSDMLGSIHDDSKQDLILFSA